jgi:CubicO group peptidase (beta-lactamase class C family)
MPPPATDAMVVGFDPDRLSRIDDLFRGYVDDGRLVGWQILISRDRQLVHASTYGWRDRDAEIEWTDDSVVRLYSMSKPITSVAAMVLYEQGAFELKDPVSRFIPSFADARVYRGGSHLKPVTEGLTSPMTIWHLLTHTSGLTYGFHERHVTDAIYRSRGYVAGGPEGADLAACCEDWASMPLAFQPGEEWNYGVSTDVLGRVIEVASGMSLDRFLDERVLGPLGMVDTGFSVRADHEHRVARLYGPDGVDGRAEISPFESSPEMRDFLSGGGGMWGTAADYLRFCHFMLNRGELDGRRVLGSRTVDYMVRNHLPGGADLEQFGRPLLPETFFDGMGFGLGFSVTTDAVANKVLSSTGEFAWGGAASTEFWCDPLEGIAAVFVTQLRPGNGYPISTQLKQLVYQALVD